MKCPNNLKKECTCRGVCNNIKPYKDCYEKNRNTI